MNHRKKVKDVKTSPVRFPVQPNPTGMTPLPPKPTEFTRSGKKVGR